jgi:FMN phosphatase YigB (HAD superfamily)
LPLEDPYIRTAIQRLRAAGLKTALLTNTAFATKEKTKILVTDELDDFDAVVMSCKVRLRKPDPAIYIVSAVRK